MISLDDPAHQARRRLISDLFTPRAVLHLEQAIRDDIAHALSSVRRLGQFEVVDALAARIPALVTCRLLGWPDSHWRDVKSWSERLMLVDALDADSSLMSDASRAIQELGSLAPEYIAAKHACPTNDIITRWSRAVVDGGTMSMRDVVYELGLVVPGGAETTRTTIARSLVLFAERNDLFERLATNPDVIPRAVEELLRWITPLNNMFRTASRDVQLAGISIHKDDRLALIYPSANRDEAVFKDSFEIDFHRDPNPHIAFGFGTHFCLGAHIARLILRVVLEELSTRMTKLRAVSAPTYKANVFVKTVERFDLAFSER
jgi:cytochrome P450 family 142 subfamily A polypeptide 1